jgi:3-oxoacyl-[acyl-carrier-protein] synthase III
VNGFFKQDGGKVQKFAVRRMTELLGRLGESGPLDYMVGHQASLGIDKFVASDRIGVATVGAGLSWRGALLGREG